MEFYDLFYKWVPTAVRLPVLFLLLFCILTCNGVYPGNTVYMYNDLGDYPEPFTMATTSVYLGMGMGMIVALRLRQRFPGKKLLLYGLICLLAMNIVCATTGNPWVMIAATLFLGFSKITAFMEVFVIWLLIWSKKLEVNRVYPFVYTVALAGIYFVTWFMSREGYLIDWRNAYLVIGIVLGCCILLVLVLVENHPLKKVVPLYQIDWLGMVLFTCSMLCLNYVVTFGKVEDWYASQKIKVASFACVLLLLLFSRRQLKRKRPLIILKIFRIARVRVALILFLALGLFTPSTFQSAFTFGVLDYEVMRNGAINLYLIPGVLAGAVLSFYWYYNAFNPRLFMIIGFISFLVYHVMMYNLFSTQIAYHDFILPSIVKGFATIVLYISLGLYATYKQPIPISLPTVGMVLVVRSFLATAVFSGIYSYLLYAQQVRSLNYLGGLTDSAGTYTGGTAPLNQMLHIQATLAASKQLTGYIILIGIFLTVILIIWAIRGWFVERCARDLQAAAMPAMN